MKKVILWIVCIWIVCIMVFIGLCGTNASAFEEHELGDLGLPADYARTMKRFDQIILNYDSFIKSLPAAFDWRNAGVVTPAKDQGKCGSCWAFAAVGAFESKILMAGGPLYDLSEEQQIACNTNDGNAGCCGGFINALRFWGDPNIGPVLESCTGYADSSTSNPDTGECLTERVVSCNSLSPCSTLPYRTTGYYTVAPHLIDSIKISIHDDGPCCFRFDVYGDFESFWENASPGTVYKYSSGNLLGGHSVLIIGWDDAKGAWLCKNSWGATDGPNHDGTFWIAYTQSINMRYGMANVKIISLDQPPICNADGPYRAECRGAAGTSIQLDGTGSSDPDSGDTLSYSWFTDCPGSSFDNSESPTPLLTIDSSSGCLIYCSVTLTVTDIAGKSSSCMTTVTIADTTPPVITCPANITVEAEGPDGVPASNAAIQAFLNAATAIDTVDGQVSVYNNAPAVFGPGNTEVGFITADSAVNISTCTAIVSVVDTTPPVIICPANITVEAKGPDGVPASDAAIQAFLNAATATDTVDGQVSVYNNAPAVFGPGNTVVGFITADSAVNISTCTALVSVVDTTPPVLSNCPADIVVKKDQGVFGAVVTWVPPTFIDNCELASIVSSHEPGDFFPVGQTTVSYTATDGYGNTTVCTFRVTVEESLTLIELDQFTTLRQNGHIVIIWDTLSEIDNAGFNLWRSESENGTYTKINPRIIEAEGGITLGAEYSYMDDTAKPGIACYYTLEDIDTTGISTFHGPVSAMPVVIPNE